MYKRGHGVMATSLYIQYMYGLLISKYSCNEIWLVFCCCCSFFFICKERDIFKKAGKYWYSASIYKGYYIG